MMDLAESLEAQGFRRRDERQPIASHAWLASAFSSLLTTAIAIEAIAFRASLVGGLALLAVTGGTVRVRCRQGGHDRSIA